MDDITKTITSALTNAINEKETFKLINGFMISYFIAITLFFWRGAQGIGNHLNAVYITKLRELLIKIELFKNTHKEIKKGYSRRKRSYHIIIFVQYTIAFLSLITLILFLYNLHKVKINAFLYFKQTNFYIIAMLFLLPPLFTHVKRRYFRNIEKRLIFINGINKDKQWDRQRNHINKKIKVLTEAIETKND